MDLSANSAISALLYRYARAVDSKDWELYRSVYAAVAAGGSPDEPDYPTFRDGHRQLVLAEAIARSSRERRWIEVTA